MKWLKKLFGVKDKVEEKPLEPLLPIKDEEQPISVPDENIPLSLQEGLFTTRGVMDIVQPEEPVAPTLERQDEIVDDGKINWDEPIKGKTIEMESNRIFIAKDEEGKKKWKEVRDYAVGKKDKNKKPKKQAKKKDNRNPDDDKSSWPGNKHFNL